MITCVEKKRDNIIKCNIKKVKKDPSIYIIIIIKILQQKIIFCYLFVLQHINIKSYINFHDDIIAS